MNNYGVLSTLFLNGFVPNASPLDVHMSWPEFAYSLNNSYSISQDTWPFLSSTTSYSASYASTNNLPNNGCGQIPATGWSGGFPNCGTTNPFSGPGVNELLLYQTISPPYTGPCASWEGSFFSGPAGSSCTTALLGRLGFNGISALNPSFNAQNATIAWSQTGKYVSVVTDWWCTFGNAANSGNVICGGLPWQASFAYASGAVITPSSNNTPNCTFTSSGGTSGATQPTTWASGSTCASTVSDNGMTWTSVGKQNARYDVVVISTTPNSLVGAPSLQVGFQ
jgi:hypothetical protein